MRARQAALLAAAALTACGDLTDGLGHCVEGTPRWWPLRDGVFWRYEEFDLQTSTEMLKDLTVEYESSRIGGLLGDERGARTWRADWIPPEDAPTVVESGWRWFLDTGSAFAFRRDIWTVPAQVEAPCATMSADDDPALCAEATPIRDVYYVPWRTRLDYGDDKVCEGSTWDVVFTERTIAIGVKYVELPDLEPCDLETWRADPLACPWQEEERSEIWDIQYADRTIEVPAGSFPHSLCARRIGENDKTYCFAKDVGKVFELDRTRLLECLASYQVDSGTSGPPADWDYPCKIDQVEDPNPVARPPTD